MLVVIQQSLFEHVNRVLPKSSLNHQSNEEQEEVDLVARQFLIASFLDLLHFTHETLHCFPAVFFVFIVKVVREQVLVGFQAIGVCLKGQVEVLERLVFLLFNCHLIETAVGLADQPEQLLLFKLIEGTYLGVCQLNSVEIKFGRVRVLVDVGESEVLFRVGVGIELY